MKQLFTTLFILFGLSSFGQNVTLTDWDNNDVIEYVKTSEDGTKIEEGHILAGEYHGKWISYFSSGEVRVIAHFKMGKKDGHWKFYNEEGQLTHEVVYEENRRVSAAQTRYFE